MDFRLLGPLEVLDNGRSIQLGGPKQRALLAVLLLHANDVVSAERLVDELWGDDAAGDERQDRPGLRLAPAQGARRPTALVTAGAGVSPARSSPARSTSPASSDWPPGRARRRAGARGARSCARRSRCGAGRRSPTSPTSRSPRPQIARLEELRAVVQEERIDAELAVGRHADLVGELEALVAEHPLRERLRGQLMLAPVPLGPPGRGARGLPRRAPRARGGARHRAGPRAARARAGDPRAEPASTLARRRRRPRAGARFVGRGASSPS